MVGSINGDTPIAGWFIMEKSSGNHRFDHRLAVVWWIRDLNPLRSG